MGQIYRSACQTLVWLGEETTDVEQSLQSIKSIRDRFPTYDDDFKFDTRFTDDDLASLRIDSGNWEWEPVLSLLHRPWFERKWVTLLNQQLLGLRVNFDTRLFKKLPYHRILSSSAVIRHSLGVH
jgi:hypothetical protein